MIETEGPIKYAFVKDRWNTLLAQSSKMLSYRLSSCSHRYYPTHAQGLDRYQHLLSGKPGTLAGKRMLVPVKRSACVGSSDVNMMKAGDFGVFDDLEQSVPADP